MPLAALALSLLFDQLVRLLITGLHPEWISQGGAWLGLISPPWSSGLGLVLIGIVAGKKPGLGVGLALGGALSNLVTFSITGHAVDYLRFGSVVTNLADILIIVGLGWHALTLVYQKSLPEEAPKRKWYQ